MQTWNIEQYKNDSNLIPPCKPIIVTDKIFFFCWPFEGHIYPMHVQILFHAMKKVHFIQNLSHERSNACSNFVSCYKKKCTSSKILSHERSNACSNLVSCYEKSALHPKFVTRAIWVLPLEMLLVELHPCLACDPAN